jgi:hypothetical protein
MFQQSCVLQSAAAVNVLADESMLTHAAISILQLTRLCRERCSIKCSYSMRNRFFRLGTQQWRASWCS